VLLQPVPRLASAISSAFASVKPYEQSTLSRRSDSERFAAIRVLPLPYVTRIPRTQSPLAFIRLGLNPFVEGERG
jgi:hypothetical protein